MLLPKYSIGIGDRFAHQGPAQLDALLRAAERGMQIAPVWNKSHREHAIVGSSPRDVRSEADAACRARGWSGPFFVDADHIGLRNVDAFLNSSDFFTLDVADSIGTPPAADDLARFVVKYKQYVGRLQLPDTGLDHMLQVPKVRSQGTGVHHQPGPRDCARSGNQQQASQHKAPAQPRVTLRSVRMGPTCRRARPGRCCIGGRLAPPQPGHLCGKAAGCALEFAAHRKASVLKTRLRSITSLR